MIKKDNMCEGENRIENIGSIIMLLLIILLGVLTLMIYYDV